MAMTMNSYGLGGKRARRQLRGSHLLTLRSPRAIAQRSCERTPNSVNFITNRQGLAE